MNEYVFKYVTNRVKRDRIMHYEKVYSYTTDVRWCSPYGPADIPIGYFEMGDQRQ